MLVCLSDCRRSEKKRCVAVSSRLRRRRGGERETGGGQGDVCPARHQGSSRVSCADLRSGPTSTMTGLGPFFTLRA